MRSLLLLVFCSGFTLLRAQNDSILESRKYSGHMMLSLGYAKPLEDMASRSTFGMAKNGTGLQFLVQIPLSKRLGLCLAFDRALFYVNQDELYKRSGTYTMPYVSGEMSSVTVSQNWAMTVFNLGGFANLPLSHNKKISLDLRFLFGSCVVTSPGISCTYATFSYTTLAVSYKTETLFSSKSNNIPITFLLGLGLRFDLNPDWCLALNFDYLNVLQETEFDEIEVRNTQNQTSTSPKKLDLGYYTFKLGIGRFF